jgi:hypothetical protein
MRKLSFKNVKPPQWIVDLKPGKYYITDLIEITGFTSAAIAYTLKKYGVTIKKEPCPPNLYRNLFIWKGYDENYRLRVFKKQQKNQ